MPVDGPVPWDRSEHTAAKHDIYRRYLHRWFPIILSADSWNSATYAEGFAGPGVYTKNEDGSPIIAIDAFVNKVSSAKKTAKFLFIDDDKRCIESLKRQLKKRFPERPRPAATMPVTVQPGQCAVELGPALERFESWGEPILAVLDSWGNAPVPYSLISRIADNPGSEVIVTLEPQHFIRFLSSLGDAADDVFGGDRSWRDAGTIDSSAKRQFILNCYRSSLRTAGFQYLLDFELIDRRGNALYLIFGTNHRRGVEKMKDSLWEVDKSFGVGFRDPRDEQLETLFDLDSPQLTPLGRLLLKRLQLLDEARVEDLRTYALFRTVFRPEHVIQALRPLIESGEIILDGGGQIRRASIVRAAEHPSTDRSRGS